MGFFTAAGVLPKSTYNKVEHYYFGVTKSKGELTTFCGKRDAKDKSIKECAIREFNEESLGAIVGKKTIKKVLGDKQVKKVENLKTKQVTYIAKVKIKGNPMTKFQKKLKNPKLKKSQKEITEIVAIPRFELIKLLNAKSHHYKGHLFRRDAREAAEIALQSGKL